MTIIDCLFTGFVIGAVLLWAVLTYRVYKGRP